MTNGLDKRKLFFRNKSSVTVITIGITVLVLFLAAHASFKKSQNKKVIEGVSEETRRFYSKEEIERLIAQQVVEVIEKKETETASEVKKPVKRDLNSEIVVHLAIEQTDKRQKSQDINELKPSLPTGTKIKAYLANSIFSFNVSSPVIAVVDEDVKQGKDIVIPKGSQFIGNAGVLKSKDRVNIKFNTLVLPNGREIKIKAMALSLDGSGGIPGDVDREWDKSIFKGIGEIALSGAALAVGTQDRAITLEDQIRLNAARNLTDDAENALRKVKVQQSITVEAFTPIIVLLVAPI